MIEAFKFYLLPSLINFFGVTYIQGKILNRKISYKNIKFYIALFVFLIFNILGYVYINGFLRFVSNTIIIIITSYLIYKDKINKIIEAVVIEQIIYFFSEFVVASIVYILNLNFNLMSNNLLCFSFINLLITTIAILIYYIPIVRKFIYKIIIYFESISSVIKYLLIFIFLISLNFLIMLIYYKINSNYILIIDFGFITIYSVILYSALKEKSENIKYKEQNKMLIDNLNEYEKMLDYQRVSNHENKNQLLVIQGMIDKTNTKALEYLDEIIKEKREDDEGIYTSASIIPQGGLQGLVYQKMLKMKENNITINLKVERKVRKINLDNLPSKTNYDLCRAVGIIIDNAIEENLNLKEREILICMYILDEYLVIEVSNKCSVIPDMTRLDEKGYTTKSNGHGYGLSLLKEIVDSNKNIINERSINKDIFTQIIKIKK